MGIEERQQLAVEGIVVAAVDVVRGVSAGGPPQDPSSSSADVSSAARPSQLRAQIRVTTRAMWVDNGRLLEVLHKVGSPPPRPPPLPSVALHTTWQPVHPPPLAPRLDPLPKFLSTHLVYGQKAL